MVLISVGIVGAMTRSVIMRSNKKNIEVTMLDNQHIQSHWPTIKNQVLSRWAKLTESEVEKTHGIPNDLKKLVQTKYGHHEEFTKTYEKICQSSFHSSKNIERDSVNNNRDDIFLGDSPEKRLNPSYSKVDHVANINRETDDELSAYSPTSSHPSLDDEKVDDFYNEIDNSYEDEHYTHFTSPDEFYPSHGPGLNGSDIPLGRNKSSATKVSTAQAAPSSSEVSSNDAKKKS